MLTNKDYCDYDVTVALEEIGFPIRRIKVNGVEKNIPISLYEAQKFLREEKKIDICLEVNTKNDRLSDKYYTVCISYMSRIKREYQYLNENFNSYEEALLEGFKEVVQLLKEE